MPIDKFDYRINEGHPNIQVDLSIVIPVYNTELIYIKKCLSSVSACRDFGISLEVILVDDGSESEYVEQLRSVVNELTPFASFFSKSNGGQNSARSLGINYATGRYVLFLDSDDFLIPEELDNTVSAALKYNPQILLYNLCRIDEYGSLIDYATIRSADFIWIDHSEAIFESGCLSRQLYRRDILQASDITLVEGPRIGEDMASAVPLLLSADKVGAIGTCPYHYVQRSSSALHSVPASRVPDIINASEQMLSRISEKLFNQYQCEIEGLCIEHIVYWGSMRAFKLCGVESTYRMHMSEWMDSHFPGWRFSKGAIRALKKYGLEYLFLSFGSWRVYGFYSKLKDSLSRILSQ